MSIHFLHAEYLLVLAGVVPLVLALVYLNERSQKVARRRYGEERLIDRGLDKRPGPRVVGMVWTAITALVVLAAAGPTLAAAPDSVKAGTLQTIVVTDVSRSSGAEDYRGKMPGSPAGSSAAQGPSGSRVDMAKYQMLQILESISGNQMGVVTYQGEGFAQADLTEDFAALRFVIANFVRVGGAPGGGSDFGRGMRVALETFKRDYDSSKQRVIVLFSDGGFTGDPAEYAEVLAEMKRENIKLVVVGIGGKTPVPIPQYDADKKFITNFKANGRAVTTAIEERPLRQLASVAGAEYHYIPVGSTDLDIHWSTALGGTRSETQNTHLYPYVLAAALLLLLGLYASGLKEHFNGKRS